MTNQNATPLMQGAWSQTVPPRPQSRIELPPAHFALLTLATISLAATCLRPDSAAALASLAFSLMWFSYRRCDGLIILPSALAGIFAPFRLLGSLVANQILSGPLATAAFDVRDISVTTSAIVTYILVVASNVNLSAQRLRKALHLLRPLPRAHRQICWISIITASATFVIQAGGIPILRDDAEASRVSAQAGFALLVFLAFVPAVILAIDEACRRSMKLTSLRHSACTMLILCAVLLISGSRLPVLITIYSYFATVISLRRLRGEHTLSLIVGSTSVMAILAVAVGAWRAAYVGLEKGAYGAIEHFLRRVSADAGNMQLLYDRDVPELISLREFALAPFVTYLPGAQRNLGQILKDRLGLTFEGGGITVPMPVEAYGMLGMAGLFVIPIATASLIVFAARIQEEALHTSAAPILWIASLVGLMNLGIAGLFEVLGSAIVPFALISAAIGALGSTAHHTTNRRA